MPVKLCRTGYRYGPAVLISICSCMMAGDLRSDRGDQYPVDVYNNLIPHVVSAHLDSGGSGVAVLMPTVESLSGKRGGLPC
jgi:hypothetical protein